MFLRTPAALALASLGTVALAACGGSNAARTISTVTVTAPSGTTPQSGAPRSSGTTPTRTTTTPAARTRTATAPAFTGGTGSGSSGGLASAVARLRALGFSPLGTGSYDSGQTLRVLIGARTGSADARTQRAFFFNGSRFLGTDTADTSAEIRVSGQGDTSVTLTYGIYRARDPLCCPTGGKRAVRFQLDMGRLTPLDPIPSAGARR